MDPILFTYETKFVAETVSVISDFSDLIFPGETLNTPLANVTLISGYDVSPNDMLYLPADLMGNRIEQRIRLGVPGCIYSVELQLSSSLGNQYRKETILAVIPTVGSAVPSFTSAYLTSTLYPYEYMDRMNVSSKIIGSYWISPLDKMFVSTSLTVGSVYGGQVTYNCPVGGDKVSVSSGLTLGNVYGGSVSYSFGAGTPGSGSLDDKIEVNSALVIGSVYGSSVTYTYSGDKMQVTSILSSGTVS